MLPNNRPPTSPGEVLVEEFLRPLNLSQNELARRMGVPIQRLNTVATGKRAVTAGTALLLARELGTTAEFWMTLQVNLDLWVARREMDGRTPSKPKAPRLKRAA